MKIKITEEQYRNVIKRISVESKKHTLENSVKQFVNENLEEAWGGFLKRAGSKIGRDIVNYGKSVYKAGIGDETNTNQNQVEANPPEESTTEANPPEESKPEVTNPEVKPKKPRKKKTWKPRVFYMSIPNKNYTWWARNERKEYDPYAHAYKFYEIAPNQATFVVYLDKKGYKYIIGSQNWWDFLRCAEITNYDKWVVENANTIETIKAGKAYKDGDKWRLSQKAIAEFAQLDPYED